MLIGAIKLIGGLAVSAGVGKVTSLFIKSITPSNATKIVKVVVGIGSWFIGGVLAMEASKKFNGDVDKAVSIVKRIKNIKININKKESKEEAKTEEVKTETEAE